jgi:phage terminase large subunit-like protein
MADKRSPPWRFWKGYSRAARAIRFIETYCRVPSGINAGELIHLARFQRETLEELLADGVRTGALQIPRGNAKSTLSAAVGLWALCDHPDSPQVPLVAFNSLQAQRTLFRPVRSMIRAHPDLSERVVVYSASGDRRAWSAWNDGELLPLPADESRLQGLNPTVALIDEAQELEPSVLSAILQGAGKRPESLVLAIGTPKPGGQDSALYTLREQAQRGAKVAWVEYGAPAGCDLDDVQAWLKANPAIAAGMLHVDVLDSELALVTEAQFRCYRLGQWIDTVVADWLPSGAWEHCPRVGVPPDGTEVVLALAGSWTSSSVALVGATGDGALFVAWADDAATDDQLLAVIAAASARWKVLEVCVAPRTRPNLVAALADDAVPVEVWPNKLDLEVASATEWRRAIIEGRVAHDHHPLLAAHVAASVARSTPDGSLRLAAPDDDRPVDAARAARMAWWRSLDVGARLEAPGVF